MSEYYRLKKRSRLAPLLVPDPLLSVADNVRSLSIRDHRSSKTVKGYMMQALVDYGVPEYKVWGELRYWRLKSGIPASRDEPLWFYEELATDWFNKLAIAENHPDLIPYFAVGIWNIDIARKFRTEDIDAELASSLYNS